MLGGAAMGRKYQNIVETIGNTPVVRINRLAPQGVNLFVKIEAFNPLGSVKDRLALGGIEAAEKSCELKPGQTVIEETSGNTGISLSMVCIPKRRNPNGTPEELNHTSKQQPMKGCTTDFLPNLTDDGGSMKVID